MEQIAKRTENINILPLLEAISKYEYANQIIALESNKPAAKQDKAMIAKAIEMIKTITTEFEEGQIFSGVVTSIKEFGAFVEFAPGKEGMVHIAKIAKERINHVEDVLTLGDKVKCICLGKDKMGRISFSIKDVPAEA